MNNFGGFNKNLTVIIKASGPPAIIMQKPEIIMNVKMPRITQFFHLKIVNKNKWNVCLLATSSIKVIFTNYGIDNFTCLTSHLEQSPTLLVVYQFLVARSLINPYYNFPLVPSLRQNRAKNKEHIVGVKKYNKDYILLH